MPSLLRTVLVLVSTGAVLGAVNASAVTSAVSVPFAPNGDSTAGSSGAAVALTPQSFVIASLGPDTKGRTADDTLLFVTNLSDVTPTVTPITIGFLPNYSGRAARLTATSVLVTSAGADGTWITDDDLLNLVELNGAETRVTPIVVGNIGFQDGCAAEPLSSDLAVLSSFGADHAKATADDVVVVVSGLGKTNTVTRVAAPFIRDSGRSRAERLSPTSFLVASNGPLAADPADDVVYLFTGAGGVNQRTDLAVPGLFDNSPGRPVRVTPTRAVVSTIGPDGNDQSPDDRLVLLDGLGSTNTITPFTVGTISDYGAGRATPLSPEVLVVETPGPDGSDRTSDDGYVVVRNLGTTRDLTTITIGGLDEDNGSHATRLAPTVFAFATSGPDGTYESLSPDGGIDDSVAIVTLNAQGTADVRQVHVPGIDAATTSVVVALSGDAFLVAGGGADHKIAAGLDDTVTLVTGASSATPFGEAIPVGSSLASSAFACVAQPLGGGRAVFAASGPGGNMNRGSIVTTDGDDVMRIVSGLPDARGLSVRKLALGFSAAKPEKGESISVSAVVRLDEPALLTGSQVTISVGRASQTLPAGAFVAKKGGKFEYADKKGALGFLHKVRYVAATGKLTISGKGVATGAERTRAAYVPVALDCDDVYLSALVTGTAGKKGITFKE